MRVANHNLILLLALCVLCAAEDRRINWTVDEIQQYSSVSSPLQINLGDVIFFDCEPGSYSNAFYLTNLTAYDQCNGELDSMWFRLGNCINNVNDSHTFSVTVNEKSDVVSNLQFFADTTYFFVSFSNGNDLANALGQSISGGQCANGLKMAVRVNPPPGTGSPSDLTSTADPGNSGGLSGPSDDMIVIIAVAVSVGVIVVVGGLVVVLLVCCCCCSQCLLKRQKANISVQEENGELKKGKEEKITKSKKGQVSSSSKPGSSNKDVISGKPNGTAVNGSKNQSSMCDDPPPPYENVSQSNKANLKNKSGTKTPSNTNSVSDSPTAVKVKQKSTAAKSTAGFSSKVANKGTSGSASKPTTVVSGRSSAPSKSSNARPSPKLGPQSKAASTSSSSTPRPANTTSSAERSKSADKKTSAGATSTKAPAGRSGSAAKRPAPVAPPNRQAAHRQASEDNALAGGRRGSSDANNKVTKSLPPRTGPANKVKLSDGAAKFTK